MLPILFHKAVLPVVHSAGLQGGKKPLERKVRIYSGPISMEPLVVWFNYAEKYGLRKFQGIFSARYSDGSIVVRKGGSAIYIGSSPQSPTELFSISDSKRAPTPRFRMPNHIFNVRQEILSALEDHHEEEILAKYAKLPLMRPEPELYTFVEAFVESSRSTRSRTVGRGKLVNSWAKLFFQSDYTQGLNSADHYLAYTFSQAVEVYSDTWEIQTLLSERMIERDPTNPIAWYYLAQKSNAYLCSKIDLDWKPQLRLIQVRMGKWTIGKDFLARRFAESH